MMESTLGVLEALGFFLVAPVIIGFVVVGSTILISRVKHQARIRHQINNRLVCSIDADCPEGYVCMEGVCVPVMSQGNET